jgi:hypothetical protein
VCFVFSRSVPPCPYFLFAGFDFFCRRVAPHQGSASPRARVSRVCSSSAPARSSAPPSVFLFFPATAAARVSLPMDLPSCSPWVDFHSTRCLVPPPSGFGFCCLVVALATPDFSRCAPPCPVVLPVFSSCVDLGLSERFKRLASRSCVVFSVNSSIYCRSSGQLKLLISTAHTGIWLCQFWSMGGPARS